MYQPRERRHDYVPVGLRELLEPLDGSARLTEREILSVEEPA